LSSFQDNFLAMARPNLDGFEKLVEQFHKHGIKSVINLQTPGNSATNFNTNKSLTNS